ncbi:DUF6344 domain-containing protein [Streptomyces sp. NPDC057638]|uniref:DUF6344 domain-containing protein n=1 Tax=Streptomyces sp. NPDC057638 TaxID=3346190 RepID=UPI003691B5FC
MAAIQVSQARRLWAVLVSGLVSVLVPLLSLLGLARAASALRRATTSAALVPVEVPVLVASAAGAPADAATAPPTPERRADERTGAPAEPAERSSLPRQGERRVTVRAVVPAQGPRWSHVPRVRSLPPTIKQRIGAEAHGTSPAVRKLPALDLGTFTVPTDDGADSGEHAQDSADADPHPGGAHHPGRTPRRRLVGRGARTARGRGPSRGSARGPARTTARSGVRSAGVRAAGRSAAPSVRTGTSAHCGASVTRPGTARSLTGTGTGTGTGMGARGTARSSRPPHGSASRSVSRAASRSSAASSAGYRPGDAARYGPRHTTGPRRVVLPRRAAVPRCVVAQGQRVTAIAPVHPAPHALGRSGEPGTTPARMAEAIRPAAREALPAHHPVMPSCPVPARAA